MPADIYPAWLAMQLIFTTSYVPFPSTSEPEEFKALLMIHARFIILPKWLHDLFIRQHQLRDPSIYYPLSHFSPSARWISLVPIPYVTRQRPFSLIFIFSKIIFDIISSNCRFSDYLWVNKIDGVIKTIVNFLDSSYALN